MRLATIITCHISIKNNERKLHDAPGVHRNILKFASINTMITQDTRSIVIGII